MTLAEFFSCSLLAFGAPLAMFALTIAHDPIRIIIMTVAMFGWLLAFLLSSLVWLAVVPLRSYLAFGMVFAVLIQEGIRYGIYSILRKTEASMKKISENQDIGSNRIQLAYVSGFGFGLVSGAFAITNVLSDSAGPGTLGLKGGSEFFFVSSAAMALCIILLNTFWSVIFYSGMEEKNYLKISWVIASHFVVSSLSLVNTKQIYATTILPSYLILIVTILLAFRSAGGTTKSFIQSFTPRN